MCEGILGDAIVDCCLGWIAVTPHRSRVGARRSKHLAGLGEVPGVSGESFTTRLGNSGTPHTFITGIRGVTTGATGAVAVLIDANGQLGTVSSSRRYKEDIQPMGDLSDRLLKLRPVTFRYKKARDNGEKPLEYGLIAEEVAEAFPELAVYNQDGQPETVAYHLLPAILLNELQKEHQKMLSQESELQQARAAMQTQGEQLAALKAQVSDVDALRAEVAELHRLTDQLVANRGQDGLPLHAAAQPASDIHVLALTVH